GTSTVLTVITAPPPVVSSCAPPRGARGQTLDVTITGSSFQPGAVASIAGGGVTVNTTTFTSPSSVVANVTIAAGATISVRDVTVTNPVGTVNAGTTNALFYVPGAPPAVTNVTP